MEESRQLSDAFYQQLSASGLQGESWFREGDIDIVRQLLQPGDVVLDLCCGYGRLTLPLFLEGYNICGLDSCEAMLRTARENAQQSQANIDYRLGDMRNLPYADDSFDKVICMWSSINHLLYVEEQIQAVNEIYRVLRKDGVALVETIHVKEDYLEDLLSKYGRGDDRRIVHTFVKDLVTTIYIHNRYSLEQMLSLSRFTRYDISDINLPQTRLLAAYLHK